jgi:hypothetical protein
MVTKGYQEGVYERVTRGTICQDAHVGRAASAACPELRKVRRAKQSGFTWLSFEKGKAEAVPQVPRSHSGFKAAEGIFLSN